MKGIILVKNLRNSDEAFYKNLCSKYYNRIYAYCSRLTGRQDQFKDFVEDSTQSTFLEACKQLPKLKKHPNIEGWLYTTARNMVNKSYRGMYIKRKHEVAFDDEISCISNEPFEEMEIQQSNMADYDKIAADILSKLNLNEYELFMDYYRARMSISDISRKYNISTTAVTTRIYRLKIKIKVVAHEYFHSRDRL